MDVKDATRTAESPKATVSGPRAFGVFAASAVAYGIGYYIAIAILFSIFGLESASDAPWEIATIGLGSVLAGVGASLVSPRPRWAPLVTAIAIAISALLVGRLTDTGFEFGIGTGILIALGAALTAYAFPERWHSPGIGR